MKNNNTKNEVLIGESESTAGLGIPSREQLVWALCEVLDGTWTWYDLQADTGLPQAECETLLAIRDAVKQQWVDSGMKMPNVIYTPENARKNDK